jgi:outer membrane protein OmpA-like peptidoglycan-associated protein
MRSVLRFRLLLTLAAAGALGACTTPRVTPKLSQAVADARAHRDAPAVVACPQRPLSEISPVTIGFGFNAVDLTPAMAVVLDEPGRWLACRPGSLAVIQPDADGHGTVAEQDALAANRGATVRNDLIRRGVSPGAIRIMARNAALPAGDNLVIRAEGRRW